MASKKSKHQSNSHGEICPPTELPTYHPKTKDLIVVVETPKDERNKYKYDEELCTFSLSSALPEGQTFPFDFGFIPRTFGDDGDPLDVLLLMDAPAAMGCAVPSRLIGVIEAEQTEDGETDRNDRLLAIGTKSVMFSNVQSVKDLNKPLLDQIEQFFISYNRIKGKKFKVKGRHGPGVAERLLKTAQKAYQKRERKLGNGKI